MQEVYVKSTDLPNWIVRNLYKPKDLISIDDLIDMIGDLIGDKENLEEELEEKNSLILQMQEELKTYDPFNYS